MRYFLELSYHGKNYHGWQRQPNGLSVQEKIEECLSFLLRFSVFIIGAGRTDKGVHAKQMFAHFDVDKKLDVSFLTQRLNAFLPKNIAVHQIFLVADDAHARFDATARTYEYWISPQKNVFYQEEAYYYKSYLDMELMNKAASKLLHYEHFECFSKSNTDVKTYRCKIQTAFWQKCEDRLVFKIKANRFLRNMVRAIVGTLMEVGTQKISLEAIDTIIQSKNRSEAGVSVPAHGLYLTSIEYPNSIKKTNPHLF